MQDWTKAVISSIVSAVMLGLTAAVKHLYGKQKCQSARQDAVEDGVKALLHDRIYQGYGECERKGFATVEDIENIDYLYRPYHALGGNGTGTELFERVKKMPVNPADRG